MTRKSLHLKRLAAISLVIVMCLSALPMLAPSASATGDATPIGSYDGGRGYVCLTFDDGLQSIYDRAFPVMSAADITATAYIVTDWIPEVATNRMSPTELHALQDAGWEIGSHSVTHRKFTELSPEDVTYEYSESKRVLTEMGFQIDTFAYPDGRYDKSILSEGMQYYTRLRTTDSMTLFKAYDGVYLGDYPSTIPHTSAHCDPISWDNVRSYIDRAVQTDSAVIFLWHSVAEDGTLRHWNGSLADFTVQMLCDYIVEMRDRYGLQVVNYRDLPNSSPDADTYVWASDGASKLASNSDNWYRRSSDGTITHGVLPTTASNLMFNETSTVGIVWDLDIVPHSIYVSRMYKWNTPFTLEADLVVGAGGVHLLSSSLVGNSHAIISHGDVRIGEGLVTDTRIVMVDGGKLETHKSREFRSLTISGDTHYWGTIKSPRLSVDEGCELYLMSGKDLSILIDGSGEHMDIDGRVVGLGTLILDVSASSATCDITGVEAPIIVELQEGITSPTVTIASADGRTASWTMTATGTVAPIVTGLKSGSYLWYLDGVEQGEVKADKDGTIALSYQSTGLHTIEVKPTPMTVAMDGVYQAVGIVAVLAVLGGLITMLGRLKF